VDFSGFFCDISIELDGKREHGGEQMMLAQGCWETARKAV